jgi:hypothetical protein
MQGVEAVSIHDWPYIASNTQMFVFVNLSYLSHISSYLFFPPFFLIKPRNEEWIKLKH